MSIFKKLAHLPIMSIGEMVAQNYKNSDNVTLVSSDTGTGRTLLIPQFCAQELDWSEIIYVLLPSRVMARNAAQNAQSLVAKEDVDLIGYRCSARDGEDSIVHEDNRIVYTTVGYALATKLLMREKNFIIDEAHEISPDMVLAKALLHFRRDENAIQPRVMLMSATFDIVQETAYWGENSTKSFDVKGNINPISFMEGDLGWGEAVDYLVNEGSTGIIIFCSGMREIAHITGELKRHIGYSSCKAFRDRDFEIVHISGLSTYEERVRALAKPRQAVKILLATKILEASVSLQWVNAGISTGDGVRVYEENGVRRSETFQISKSRLIQQAGRTNRFGPGTFILNSAVSLEERPLRDIPDTNRQSYDDLCLMAFHQDVSPVDDLEYIPSEAPSREKLMEGITRLHRLGLVSKNSSGWDLTDDGCWVVDKALSASSGAFACQASKLGCLPLALPVIARMEVQSLLFNKSLPPVESFCPSSDLINEICMAYDAGSKAHDNRKIYEEYNLNYKSVKIFFSLIESFEKSMGITAWDVMFTPNKKSFADLEDHLLKLKACMAFVYPEKLYPASVMPGVTVRRSVRSVVQSSVTTRYWSTLRPEAAMGSLVEIRPRDRSARSFIVLVDVLTFSRQERDYAFTLFGRGLFTSY